MAPYGLLASRVQSPKSKVQSAVTYDAHNAEYLLQRRAFTTDLRQPRTWPRAMYSLVQWWRLRRFERQVCLASRHVVAVSKQDEAALSSLAPSVAKRITVMPHGVDVDYWSRTADFAPMALPPDSLVFD